MLLTTIIIPCQFLLNNVLIVQHVLICSIFYSWAILINVQWYCFVKVIFISLMTKEGEQPFKSLLVIWICSFNEVSVKVSCSCFPVELSFTYWLVVLYILCRVLWLAHVVQIFSLAQWLAFGLSHSFLNIALETNEVESLLWSFLSVRLQVS